MRSPYVVHRKVENEYLVRQRDQRRLRELAAVAVAVLVLGGGLLAYTWVHVEMLRTGYRVDELEKRLQRLLESERKWRLEAAFAAHPDRLRARAREEIEMKAPTLDQTLFYEEIVGTSQRLSPARDTPHDGQARSP